MKWDYWIGLYIERHCAARGLRSSSIKAYSVTLGEFRRYAQEHMPGKEPDELSAADVLAYVEHLRRERNNGASAVNRQVTVLKNFYRAMVAMEQLEPRENPMAYFPKMKAGARKLPVVLSEEEVGKLMAQPPTNTVIGLRDRAILTLLYATGIRATECATLRECDLDLTGLSIRVVGKGGHERAIPLTEEVAHVLGQYREARGAVRHNDAVFRSRKGRGMSRNGIYERVRSHARKAGISKRVSPHRLRHTCATHLVKAGVDIVTVRDLLGHKLISSTQLYLHTTAEDLRKAAACHPVELLVERIEDLLPNVKLPFQWPPGTKELRTA